ncbi:MAG TPA: hypothetical protein V6C97_07350 [Oculatellaceae cyanobacterium]
MPVVPLKSKLLSLANSITTSKIQKVAPVAFCRAIDEIPEMQLSMFLNFGDYPEQPSTPPAARKPIDEKKKKKPEENAKKIDWKTANEDEVMNFIRSWQAREDGHVKETLRARVKRLKKVFKMPTVSWLSGAVHRVNKLRVMVMIATRLWLLWQYRDILAAMGKKKEEEKKEEDKLPRFHVPTLEMMRELCRLIAAKQPPQKPKAAAKPTKTRGGVVRTIVDPNADANMAYFIFYKKVLAQTGLLVQIDISDLWHPLEYMMKTVLSNMQTVARSAWRRTTFKYIAQVSDYWKKRKANKSDDEDAAEKRTALAKEQTERAHELARSDGTVPEIVGSVKTHVVAGKNDADVLASLRKARDQDRAMSDDKVLELLPALFFMNSQLPKKRQIQLVPLQSKIVDTFVQFDTHSLLDSFDVVSQFETTPMSTLSSVVISREEKRQLDEDIGSYATHEAVFKKAMTRRAQQYFFGRKQFRDPNDPEPHMQFTGTMYTDGTAVSMMHERRLNSAERHTKAKIDKSAKFAAMAAAKGDPPKKKKKKQLHGAAARNADTKAAATAAQPVTAETVYGRYIESLTPRELAIVAKGRHPAACDLGKRHQMLWTARIKYLANRHYRSMREAASGCRFLRYSTAERRRRSGSRKFERRRNAMQRIIIDTRMDAHGHLINPVTVGQIEGTIAAAPSCKTIDVQEFADFAIAKLEANEAMYEHFNTFKDGVYHRMRFYQYSNTQRHEMTFLNLFRRIYGRPDQCFVVFVCHFFIFHYFSFSFFPHLSSQTTNREIGSMEVIT